MLNEVECITVVYKDSANVWCDYMDTRYIHNVRLAKNNYRHYMYVHIAFKNGFCHFLGMLWQELKQVYAEGLYDYFDSLYNYLDVAVLTLYITSFTMRYVSIMKVSNCP